MDVTMDIGIWCLGHQRSLLNPECEFPERDLISTPTERMV